MIKYSCNTKAKATLKVYDYLQSYLFEQECGELSKCTSNQLKTLKDALVILGTIIKNN